MFICEHEWTRYLAIFSQPSIHSSMCFFVILGLRHYTLSFPKYLIGWFSLNLCQWETLMEDYEERKEKKVSSQASRVSLYPTNSKRPLCSCLSVSHYSQHPSSDHVRNFSTGPITPSPSHGCHARVIGIGCMVIASPPNPHTRSPSTHDELGAWGDPFPDL